MESEKSSVDNLVGHLQKNAFAEALSGYLEVKCSQMNGQLTPDMLVKDIQELVEKFYPPNTHLRMGQIMWPAVDVTEWIYREKSIEKYKLKPVFVDLISHDDIKAVLKGEKTKNIQQRAIIRILTQAREQGVKLTGVDVGSMMWLSPETILRYVREWEKEHQEIIPHRRTIHDNGHSIAHKKQICYRVIVQGKSVETVARETNLTPKVVTQLVKDYKRILACLNRGITPEDTAFAVKVSEELVYEYMNLINKYQNVIFFQDLSHFEAIDDDDMPF
jgi:hypothetical protein